MLLAMTDDSGLRVWVTRVFVEVCHCGSLVLFVGGGTTSAISLPRTGIHENKIRVGKRKWLGTRAS